MKNIYSLLLIICSHFAISQNIVQMEYFINADPGFGNATNVPNFPPTTPASISNFGFEIDNTFSNGIHTIGYRTKDANNIWSHTNFSTFYVIDNTPLQNMIAMEYFIDSDPGFGNATNVPNFPPTTSTSISNFGFTFNNTLSNGIHTIGYRSKDASNKWSHTNFSTFYVLENNLLYDIVELEYFWDIDAGFGNNTMVTVSNPTNNLFNYPFDVNVPANLSIGDHKLFIRSKDSNGTFSHINYIEVAVEPTVGLSEIEKLGIQLYPNPVKDILNVKLTDNESFRLLIYDINGKLITDKVVNSSTQIDLSHLSSGVYNAFIWKEANNIKSSKLIKM